MCSDSDDRELVQRVRSGDQEAFRLLFHRYNEPLGRQIFRKVRNHHDMEDIRQQVYEKVHKSLHTPEEISSFKRWLYVITKNTIKDFLRAKRIRPPSSGDSPQEDLEDTSTTVEEHVIQKEILELAWEKIRKKLTPTQMQCFIWDLEGVKTEEIARRLRLGKRTVRTYVSKVYRLLREAYRGSQSNLEEVE